MQFVQFSIENFSKTIDEDNGPKCHSNILELLFATKSCNNNYTDFITGVSEVNMCSSSIVYNTTIYTAALSTEHVFSSSTTSFKVVSKYPKWTTYVCSDGDAFHITVSILSSATFGHRSGILEGSPDLNLASSSHATGFDVGRMSLFVFLVLDFEIQ